MKMVNYSAQTAKDVSSRSSELSSELFCFIIALKHSIWISTCTKEDLFTLRKKICIIKKVTNYIKLD